MAWGETDSHRVATEQRLAREFAGVIPPDTIHRTLEESYARWNHARITMYVPVLAERFARDHLRSMAQRQIVEVARAVASGARVFVFDEPTSSLGEHEAAQLFALIARVRAQGATCLYVSHRMAEIFQLCDTVTVLRDGTHVATRPLAGLDERALVQMMIGRNLESVTPEHLSKEPGPVATA